MVKRITQPTFDSIVKENMEDFSLNLPDALKEAILQLTQQGITLDNIDITGGIDMDELKSATLTVNQFSRNESVNEDTLSVALVNIRKLCSQKDKNQIRNKNIILREGCLYSLYQILKLESSSPGVITNVLETIIHLSKSDGMFDQILYLYLY